MYRYIEHSLKATTREKRGDGTRTKVALDTKMPTNWMDFLRNDQNKTELFALLSKSLSQCTEEGAILYSTSGESAVSNCPSAAL